MLNLILPMVRTSTLVFKLYGLSSKSEQEIYSLDNTLPDYKIELLQLLGDSNLEDVRQGVVDDILSRAREMN